MVFPYYPRPKDDEQEPDEEQQREESRRRFNRARFERIRRRYERMRQRRQLQDRTQTLTAEQLEYQHDSESYRRPTSAPVSRPSTRPNPTSSPHDYADPPASQSSGQASSSKSDEQGSKGSSQDEDSTDANQAKDETSAQVVLRDIEEVQDDFGTIGIFDGISPDRLHHYSNPDVIRVQQDMEQRPLIFKRCFEQAESPRSALEFIYANCPVTDESELRHLEQVAQDQSDIRAGMAEGSTGDAPNDVQETFTLDDVRQFTEIDLATETFDADDAAHYEKLLEAVFEYVIVFDDENYNYSPEDKIRQMHNLARSNLHIVDYLNEVFVNDDKTSGLTAFQQYFSESKYGQLKVYLGADIETGGPDLGRGPLPESTEQNLDTVFLGSQVNIASIVHEFGHVLDRSIGIEDEYTDTWGTVFPWPDWINSVGLPLNELIYKHAIGGYAGKQFLTDEVWADIFMTAVLDPSNPGISEPYEVLSTTYQSHYDFVKQRQEVLSRPYVNDHGEKRALQIGWDLAIKEFYDCTIHKEECDEIEVKWADEPDSGVDYGALAREHFPTLLRHLLRESMRRNE